MIAQIHKIYKTSEQNKSQILKISTYIYMETRV